LSTAYQIGNQIFVLYQGLVAEAGPIERVIDSPQHPYVQLLVDSVPVPDPKIRWEGRIDLPPEEEMRQATSVGCRYYSRCPHRMDRCQTAHPPLYPLESPEHTAACYLYDPNADVEKLDAQR
ncbi:MAG: ABC transporter ATP-binding protein, partial [Anaerolineae bacterium]|nr:ABC transporter ATP-binding protein [Anaerolineae bacterium]